MFGCRENDNPCQLVNLLRSYGVKGVKPNAWLQRERQSLSTNKAYYSPLPLERGWGEAGYSWGEAF